MEATNLNMKKWKVKNTKGEILPMKIKEIIVDEMPESCGKCCLMKYSKSDFPFCAGIDDGHNEITGNPNDMKYRRSDCPLVVKFPNGRTIDSLELSVRSYNCLKRNGIRTVDELKAMTDEELMQVRNLGSRCIEEIKKIIGGLE